AILVFRQRKAAEREGKVLFIDASELYRSGRNQNMLEREHEQQILEWYQAVEDIAGRVHVATLDEIAGNDWNLNIARYVEPLIKEETITVAEAVENLNQAVQAAYAAEDRLLRLLKENGLVASREET